MGEGMRKLILFALCAGLCWAETKSETGDLNGAKFRIDLPEKWNGGLVMYCHGYSTKPGSFGNPKLSPALAVFVEEGFALAQSGYVAGGWAVAEAMQDTEALRRYFTLKYGKPKETYVTGHSMGGHLTVALVESFPDAYDGGLELCGPLGAAHWFMMNRVFGMRAVFDYYFPGALPSPVKVPSDFAMNAALTEQIVKLLEGKSEQAAAVRRFSEIKDNKGLAQTLVFWTYILKDLQERGGGNPFDNRNIIYANTGDDNAVNEGVERYAADPRAAEYLRRYYTPTGRLTRPLLGIHTTYDPLVSPRDVNMYQTIAEEGGGQDLFVLQYVKRDGHCAIQADEVRRGFRELREWKTTGKRPAAGWNH
jgi:pimeloyl-ACP methyl ester carboxylesterase